MKKLLEKIIYITLAIFSFLFGIVVYEAGYFYTGMFFLLIPTFTIGYSFYIDFNNRKILPTLLLLYVPLSGLVFGHNVWDNIINEPLEEPKEKRNFFIPEEGHRLYPEEGFKDLAILKDDFHGIKHDYQIDLEFEDNTFQIYEGFQGGIYSYEAWLNIPVSGEIYLKAYDLLTNTELSSDRLKRDSTLQVSNTLGEIKLFSLLDSEGRGKFSIYEGGWGEYYGARFELWYIPFGHGAGGTQKLLEDYYIIDGWER